MRRILRPILFWTVGLVLFLAVVTWAYLAELSRQRVSACQDHLRRIVQAMHSYEDVHHFLPPAYVVGKDGKPAHSWRVLLLPYLGRQDLYDAYHFDEPWDGPNNRKLEGEIGDIYTCPADRGPQWRTNYMVVVGSQTAWPGARFLSTRNISDGTNYTIAVIELANSDIPWMAPRDVVMKDLFPTNTMALGPRWGSGHGGRVNVAFCDGRTESLPADINRSVLFSCLTANGGRPWRDEWLPGEEPNAPHPFPAEINADQLRKTDVVPHLEGDIVPGRNQVYCATMQLAWDELKNKVGGAGVQVEDNPPLAAALNRGSFPRYALSSNASVARMGLVRDGIADAIRKEMTQKFPDQTFALPVRGATTVVTFAYLQKNLPFELQFGTLLDPLVFHTAAGDVSVRSFGVKEFNPKTQPAWSRQIRILAYNSGNDFIMRLIPKEDDIILAKVPPGKTLGDTVTAVQDRIGKAIPGLGGEDFFEKESLMVPDLAFNVVRQYKELIPKHLINTPWGPEIYIGQAQQTIRYMLNESGARLESEVFLGYELDGPEIPPKPRRFIFDRPFLLMMKERQAQQPYLVMWIDNAELMEPAQKAGH